MPASTVGWVNTPRSCIPGCRTSLSAGSAREVVITTRKKLRRPSVEEILKQAGARQAFDNLVKANVDPKLLEFGLSTIAALPLGYLRVPRTIARRDLARLARKMETLADQIERANRCLDVFNELALIAVVQPRSMLSNFNRLPSFLRDYAAVLDTVLSRRPPRWNPVNLRSQATAWLLAKIKQSAGRHHYQEVAQLIYAADTVSGHAHPKFPPTADALKGLARRYLHSPSIRE